MIGSYTDFKASLVSVKSVAGDIGMPPAGRRSLRSFNASNVASVRLPPAESPATNVAFATPGRLRTTAIARHQAASASQVTNRRHETVTLNDLQRHILGLLDGQNSRDMILDRLVELVASGALSIHDNGQRVTDESRTRSILRQALEKSLQDLALQALLI